MLLDAKANPKVIPVKCFYFSRFCILNTIRTVIQHLLKLDLKLLEYQHQLYLKKYVFILFILVVVDGFPKNHFLLFAHPPQVWV